MVKAAKWTKFSFKSVISLPIVRWIVVGFFFTGLNTVILAVFQEVFKTPLWLGSALSSELVTIWRFFINDRWVFGNKRPTWLRFWQYHVANLSSFIIWLAVTNFIPMFWQVDTFWGIKIYIIASIIATACSVGWSILTNFFWIWKKHPKK